MNALYICYQSLLDPLTQTQVVNYLEGLALDGFRLILLTFEPTPLSVEVADRWRAELAGKGITWHWLRYHKRPTVPATAWDIMAGVAFGLRLVHQHGVKLIHARAHVPGLIGSALKRLTGVKLLFDVRGLMAEEYVDGGRWPEGGRLYRVTKRVERQLVRSADGMVVLTEKMRELMTQWYPREIRGKPLEVIPCCVDLRKELGLNPQPTNFTIAYVGKLGGWYPVERFLDLAAAFRQEIPELRLQVWTQSDTGSLVELARQRGLVGSVLIGKVSPDRIITALSGSLAGLCLYDRTLSAAACSPTKVPEYLAAGLVVICSAGIGDTDAILAGGEVGGPVGVTLCGHSQEAYRSAALALVRLLTDPATSVRCRAVARLFFDLEGVGWARYVRLYRRMLAPQPGLCAPYCRTPQDSA